MFCGKDDIVTQSAITLLVEYGKDTGHRYTFDCRFCLRQVERNIDDTRFRQLRTLGSPLRVIGAPLEIYERPSISGKLSEEDITEFCGHLGDEDIIAKFTEGM